MFRCFWLHCCTHVCWFLSYKFYTYIVIEPISPQITNNDISSNTTVEEICDILSSRINDVTLNRSAHSGFCPSSNGYMQWNLSTTCLVSAVGIQVSLCLWFVSNWIVWSCGTMLGVWSFSVTTPNSVRLWFVSNWIVWSCGTMLRVWSYSVTTPNKRSQQSAVCL